jgi:hypothetical protein
MDKDWRPHLLRSGARFTAASVVSPAFIAAPVPTEAIERGMSLAPNSWGRDKDCMAGIVANGDDVRADIASMSGRVGIRAAGCKKLRIRVRRMSDVLFGLRLSDCEDVSIRIDEAEGLLPFTGDDEFGHLAYLDRCRNVRVKVGKAAMRGDGVSTYGTMLKFVLCDDVAVQVGEADWDWGHLEFQGCRRVRSRGGVFRSLGSRLGWGNPSTVRNHDHKGQPFRSCEDVEIRDARFEAGRFPVALRMHSNLQNGQSTPLTTARWPGTTLVAPLGVGVDGYSDWPGLKIERAKAVEA